MTGTWPEPITRKRQSASPLWGDLSAQGASLLGGGGDLDVRVPRPFVVNHAGARLAKGVGEGSFLELLLEEVGPNRMSVHRRKARPVADGILSLLVVVFSTRNQGHERRSFPATVQLQSVLL